MSLATSNNNKPWICEVHFVYDDNLNLYWRSMPSRRHSQEIAANPNVAGNIVKQHEKGELPNGIYFEGQAEVVEDQVLRDKILPLFESRLGVPMSVLSNPENELYKVIVSSWYAFGKFDGPTVQKYELKWNGGA